MTCEEMGILFIFLGAGVSIVGLILVRVCAGIP